MSYEARCAICGKKYYQESSTLAKLSGAANFAKDCEGTVFGLGTTLIRKGVQAASGKKDICPACRRAGYTDESVSGGGSSNERAEQKRKEAVHKEALRDIKYFEFPEDDSEFNRAMNIFCDDYLECNAGLLADRDYKKTYKQTAEKELKLLKNSNPAHYEKFKEAWSEARATMKKKLKTRLIISAVIMLVCVIGCGGIFVKEKSSFFAGAGCGVCFGLVFGLCPHISTGFSKSKTDKE